MKEFLKDKQLIAFTIMLILFLFIFYASLPFLNAFFGALIVYVLFNPINKWLVKNKVKKHLAAWILIVLSLIIIIIPSFFLVQGLIDQISLVPSAIEKVEPIERYIQENINPNFEIDQEKIVNNIVSFLSTNLQSIFSNTVVIITNLIIFYFLLYYLLIYGHDLSPKVKNAIPFASEKNKEKFIKKFGDITKATIIGSLLIAILQGLLLGLSFYFLGLPGGLFWGIVTAFLAFIPMIGSPIIWGPAALILLASGSLSKAIILVVLGIIISSIDNIIRPITNKKFGEIHPLISIIGVFIGISQFGIMGIFIGPLLLAYFILIWQIYKEEYLS